MPRVETPTNRLKHSRRKKRNKNRVHATRDTVSRWSSNVRRNEEMLSTILPVYSEYSNMKYFGITAGQRELL